MNFCFFNYFCLIILFILLLDGYYTINYFWFDLISDVYFIGGFGTVAWLDVKEYEALQPDKIAADGGEQSLKVN